MTTKDRRACPVCNTLFSDSSETCPVCALQGALKSESTTSSSEPELRFEHYTVLKNIDGTPVELGRGAMGVTYKAFDVHLQCPVALKIINARFIGDDSARRRFVREARAAARVRHSNVASVFHLGESGGNYFYAMEFFDGETLEKLIRRLGKLEPEMALEVMSQVAAGLTAIHKQHLIHRDIKPSNIMVSLEEGRLESVKIIDLGLAKGVAEEDSVSAVGSFTGTPGYASPEQFAGIGVDIRSDLYSLGITFWEMLTGKPPFQGSGVKLMDQHQHAALPTEKLKNVPAPIVVLLEVLLAKDPGQRVQNPGQLRKVLPRVTEALASGSPLSAPELRTVGGERTALPVPKRKPGMHVVRWLLASGLGLIGLLLAWSFFVGHHGPNQQNPEVVSTEKSIAVLPFENISANKNETYFADGVQGEILSNLAKVSQLKVISRTSVMAYRPPNKSDVRSIASALGVTYLVEGTVQRDGNRVLITTELIDTRNDKTVWSESYQKDLTDIFAIQTDIAQTVASNLSARLSPEEQKSIEERPTTDLEAYDFYLQAKELITRWEFAGTGNERDKILNAISLLEGATRKDPKFVLGYCLAARGHDDLYHYWFDKTPERLALADAAVNEALRLGPDFPEAHLASAYHLYSCYRNYERASVQITIAQRGLPNSAEALWLAARIDRRQGRWDESTKALEKALILDPRNADILYHLRGNYDAFGRYQEGAEINNRLSELEPDNPWFKLRKAEVTFWQTGDPTGYLAAADNLPSSIKDHGIASSDRFWLALCARDWTAADQILGKSSNEDLYVGRDVKVAIPRGCGAIWLAALPAGHPTMEGRFTAGRDELERRVEAHPDEAELLSALGVADAFLGRKDEAIQEATRAVGIRPMSKDAVEGPWILLNLAVVYAWTNEPELALRQLTVLIQSRNPLVPSTVFFRRDPIWDPIRKDQRFDKLLAELASHE